MHLPRFDGDGVFDYLEVAGCTDLNATNFDSNATDEDGTAFLNTDGDGVYDCKKSEDANRSAQL